MSPPSPPDPMLIATTLRTRLGFPSELTDMVSLPGDASNRRYFRLHVKGGLASSFILMQLADPEGFKASEEAVSGAAEVSELPFLNVLRPLANAGVSVPTLHYFDEAAGLLYLEDFGDLTLFDACEKGGESAIQRLYPKAIDALIQIHLRLQPQSAEGCIAFSRSFDVPLLIWEFEHFLEYGILARQDKRPLCVDHEKVFQEVFTMMVELIANQPKVFTHRDYHSRNLMVHGDRLGVIDFQDALMGPATYDLASLLRDSYIALDETFIDEMIDRYINGMCLGLDENTQDRMLLTDRIAFRRLFDFTSIQRNLKAAGRFVYIDRVKGNPKFLADIPRTLGYVRHNLETYPELEPLRVALTPYVLEWQ
ncbi:MAG: phosphotransferase [Nitrospirae bacterium]|nr:phosphotransferase [Nitrospirota bacterium]MDA1304788.1 phosphotransferase [Nitrospirota bacterium]